MKEKKRVVKNELTFHYSLYALKDLASSLVPCIFPASHLSRSISSEVAVSLLLPSIVIQRYIVTWLFHSSLASLDRK